MTKKSMFQSIMSIMVKIVIEKSAIRPVKPYQEKSKVWSKVSHTIVKPQNILF